MFTSNVKSEITRLAKANGIEPAALLAVVWVESAGQAYWTVNGEQRMPIRFEGHYFYKRLTGEKLQKALAAGLASPTAGAVKNPNNYKDRYALFERAAQIDRDAAIESTSWGLGQVMGAWWRELGYSSPVAMVAVEGDSIDEQIEMMIRFIKINKLVNKLNNHDWKGFAAAYNGPNYRVNKYDTKMAEAFAEFEGTKPGANVDVKMLQELLLKKGLYTGKIDGISGPKTENAVRAFQASAGLAVDGKAGPMTMQALQAAQAEVKAEQAKSNVPKVAAGGVAAVVAVPQILSAVTSANEVAAQTKGVLDMLNLAPWIAGAILAVIVVFVIYRMMANTVPPAPVSKTDDGEGPDLVVSHA